MCISKARWNLQPWCLAKNYSEALDESAVVSRYATRDFGAFIEAPASGQRLRMSADYALAALRMCEQMLVQNVVYAGGDALGRA